jgi:hypothetical protein
MTNAQTLPRVPLDELMQMAQAANFSLALFTKAT